MEKELTTAQQSAIELYQNRRDDIIKLFTPSDATQAEREIFLSMGAALGANPFTREIFMTKYQGRDGKPARASIFCGRDFYRRKAQEHPDYDGHYAEAVYSKDIYKVKNGEPEHEFSNGDRGNLIGAYCVVYRKSIRKPFYIFVKMSEYDPKWSIWKSKPETMIKKVAEAQGLRGAFQGIFAGTYDESEQWRDEEKQLNDDPEPIEEPPKPEEPTGELLQSKIESIKHRAEIVEIGRWWWESCKVHGKEKAFVDAGLNAINQSLILAFAYEIKTAEQTINECQNAKQIADYLENLHQINPPYPKPVMREIANISDLALAHISKVIEDELAGDGEEKIGIAKDGAIGGQTDERA